MNKFLKVYSLNLGYPFTQGSYQNVAACQS